jgi:hypothetical protein
VGADEKRASAIEEDSRSTEQLGSDVFLELLRHGAEVQPTALLGVGAPAVRVLVTETALTRRTGVARIEGSSVAVSVATAERIACGTGTVPVLFEGTQAVNLGREQRLYSRRQRIALAVRDGGCRWPGCDRPPSWTEAHHVQHWLRDHGRTDLADGLLLCRHHHLLLHNEGWQIRRDGGDFWLTPPSGVDPDRVEVRMPSKSAALAELMRV